MALGGPRFTGRVILDGSAKAPGTPCTPRVKSDGSGGSDGLLPEELADEVLEVVDAVLALGGEAAGVVGA